MLTGNLTSLSRVKAYKGIVDTSSDAQLAQLIKAQSRRFLQDIGRKIVYETVTETFDGSDLAIRTQQSLTPWFAGAFSGGPASVATRGWALNLQNWPIVSITSIFVDGGDSLGNDGTPIPAATNIGQQSQTDGWVLKENYRVELVGTTYAFTRGVQNIKITYVVGYTVASEAQTIPGTPYLVTTNEPFYLDLGVKFSSNQSPLAKVASAPAASQYSVDTDGNYTFAAADTTKGVLISYANVPAEVEQAVIEMVLWKYEEKDRMAQRTKTLDSGTVSFLTDDLPPYAAAVVRQYARAQV